MITKAERTELRDLLDRVVRYAFEAGCRIGREEEWERAKQSAYVEAIRWLYAHTERKREGQDGD